MHWSFRLYIEAYSSTQQPPPRMAIMKMRHGQSDWLRWGLDITLRFLVFFPIVEDFQSLELQPPVCPMILFCVVLDSCSSLMFCGFLPGSPFPQARGERLENICDSRRHTCLLLMHSAISPCLKIDLKLLEDLRIKMGENTLFSSVKMKFSCFNWNKYRYLSNQNLKHLFPGPVVFLGQRHNRVYFMSKCNWRVNENMGKDFADFSVYRNTQRRK